MKFDFGSLERPFEAVWPVTVDVPVDGGKVEKQEFSVKFRMLTDDEVKVTDEQPVPGKALLRIAVVGLDGEVEFTPELLEKLISWPYVRLAMQNAYRQFAVGIAAKN